MQTIKIKKNQNVGCLVSTIIIAVAAIIGLIFGIQRFIESLERTELQNLGFASKQDLEDFVDTVSIDFDENTLFTNKLQDSDYTSVRDKFIASTTLVDTSGSSINLFLENGLFDIPSMDKENSLTLNSPITLNAREFGALCNLLFESINASTGSQNPNTNPQTYGIISFEIEIIDGKPEMVFVEKQNTEIYRAFTMYFKEVFPNKFYSTTTLSIEQDANGKLSRKNLSVAFNNFSDAINAQYVKIFNNFSSSSDSNLQTIFSDLLILSLNSLTTSLDAHIDFSSNQAIITPN